MPTRIDRNQGSGFDLNDPTLRGDPGVMLTQAQIQRLLAFLQSSTLAAKQRALIDYGSGDLAGSVLGERTTPGESFTVGGKTFGSLAEAQKNSTQRLRSGWLGRNLGTRTLPITTNQLTVGPTVLAAQNNPFSTLANLRFGRQQDTHQLNEGLNQRNLFYGSERGRLLGLLGRDYDQRTYQATRGIEEYLTGLTEQVTQGQLTGQGDLENALFQAYQQRAARAGQR